MKKQKKNLKDFVKNKKKNPLLFLKYTKKLMILLKILIENLKKFINHNIIHLMKVMDI